MGFEKVSSDSQQINTLTGGVTSSDGAPLLDTDSVGGKSAMFGPAALREIQNGIANGDFGVPPQDSTAVINNTDNALPYWEFSDSSSGRITMKVLDDATTGYATSSGYTLRVTYANAAASPDYARLERWIPILGGSNRPSAYNPEFTSLFATNTSTCEVQIYCQFYKEDKSTAVGTAYSQTFTLADLYAAGATGSSGSVATKSTLNYFTPSTTSSTSTNWLRSVAPADAAYLRVLMDFQVPGAGPTADVRVDIAEIRLPLTQTDIVLSDKTAPATYGPGHIWQENGIMYIAGQQGKRTGVLVPDTFPASVTAASAGTVSIVGPVYLWGIGTNTYPVDAFMAIGDPAIYSSSPFNYEVWLTAGDTGSILIGFNPLGSTYPNTFVNGDLMYIFGDTSVEIESNGNMLFDTPNGGFVFHGDGGTYSAFYYAYRTTNQSIPNATRTAITFNADIDTRGEWDTPGASLSPNSGFASDSSGNWLIVANVAFAANGSGYRKVAIEVNGTEYGVATVPSIGSAEPTWVNVSTIIGLYDLTDVVKVFVYQNSGGALNVISDVGNSPTCKMTRVGF